MYLSWINCSLNLTSKEGWLNWNVRKTLKTTSRKRKMFKTFMSILCQHSYETRLCNTKKRWCYVKRKTKSKFKKCEKKTFPIPPKNFEFPWNSSLNPKRSVFLCFLGNKKSSFYHRNFFQQFLPLVKIWRGILLGIKEVGISASWMELGSWCIWVSALYCSMFAKIYLTKIQSLRFLSFFRKLFSSPDHCYRTR